MSATCGATFREDGQYKKLVSELIEVQQKHTQKIDGIRSPINDSGETSNLIAEVGHLRGRPLFYPYIGSGLGRGAYVELIDGSVKLDLINGIGIHVLGHSHSQVTQAALEGAMSDIVVQGNLQPNEQHVSLLKKLTSLASKNSRMKHGWITTSGSMSNENALKICRQKMKGARKILSMNNAFAGRTTLMAEITDNPAYKQDLPQYEEVLRLPFYDFKDPNSGAKTLELMKTYLKEHKGDIGCFMFEPMQGEGGYRVAPREFFVPLLELCREEGIPIWADEVQTFCRTGEFFAYETLNLGEYIDVCTVAKTLQSAATLYTPEMNPRPGLIAGTFSGSSAALAAGLKVLEVLEKDHMGPNGHIQSIHNKFVSMLNRINEGPCKGLLREAGGLGLMVAATPLDGSKEKLMKLLKTTFHNGLMVFGCGRDPYRLRFLLPAVLTDKDIEVAEKILIQSLQEVENA